MTWPLDPARPTGEPPRGDAGAPAGRDLTEQDVRDAFDHEPWNGDNAYAVDVARLNRIARPTGEPTAEPLWCVVITDAGRPTPTVVGPFATEAEARRYEDRYIDAPAGAWASFVPMWAPGDVVVLAE